MTIHIAQISQNRWWCTSSQCTFRQREREILARFDQFRLFCRKFTHFLVYWTNIERVHLYLVETKKFGATGHLDNGFRRLLSHWPRTRFQPRLYPAFLQYFERGQITSGESGMAVPRNLVHLWSAKFCSFHTRLVHSDCPRNLTSSGLSS